MTLTRARIAELHLANIASVDTAVERLRSRLSSVPSVVLDYGVDSLLALNAWFLDEIATTAEDNGSGLPPWWDPGVPMADAQRPSSNPFTLAQLQLIDEVQAYLAAVARQAYPAAEWVVYKGSRRDFKNGETMLQLRETFPFSPRTYVYGEALDVVLYNREVAPDLLGDVLTRAIDAE